MSQMTKAKLAFCDVQTFHFAKIVGGTTACSIGTGISLNSSENAEVFPKSRALLSVEVAVPLSKCPRKVVTESEGRMKMAASTTA